MLLQSDRDIYLEILLFIFYRINFMAKILFLNGPAQRLEYKIDKKENLLGRQSTNDIPIQDIKASRRHTSIFMQDGKFYIKDLGSQNGTIVNDKKIEEINLNHKDKVKIGNTVCLFLDDDTLSPEDIQKITDREIKTLEELLAQQEQEEKILENKQKKRSASKTYKKKPLQFNIKQKFQKLPVSYDFLSIDFSQYSFFSKIILFIFFLIFMLLVMFISRWITFLLI